MSYTRQLLERAKATCTPTTDYALAKKLDVSRHRLSHWMRGKAFPDNEVCFKLARLLALPIETVIAYIERDRARTDRTKRFWESQLPRLLPALALTLAGVLAPGKEDPSGPRLVQHFIHYAKQRRSRGRAHPAPA